MTGAPWIFGDAPADHPALIVADTGETLTFGTLNDRSARLANLFAADGLVQGDPVALLLENGSDFIVAVWAARRAGLLCVPLNWHLAPDEIGYILGDCGAKAVVASPRFTKLVAGSGSPTLRCYLFGPEESGWRDIEAELARTRADRPQPELGGGMMLYSSGTTGRPKGIIASGGQGRSLAELTTYEKLYRDFHAVSPASTVLTAGPLYHAAPLNWAIGPQRLGATIVIFRHFDAAACLEALSRQGVTHCQMVPIHFVRLLKLPDDVRRRASIPTLTRVVHAGAPCPVAVKAAMMDWWGPVIWEYYSGSEGFGMTAIDPEEWLAHPGSVGRPRYGGPIEIVGPDGESLPVGDIGLVYFSNPREFAYQGRESQSHDAINAKGWATFGDMGWLDSEGFLYLADRKGHMIISGGVNIYPAEIEAALLQHPAVGDAAVIGVPDEEYGERVHAVIEPARGHPVGVGLEAELAAYVRERLAGFKVPRSFEFLNELPRSEAGKLLKRELRARHWGDAKVRI